MMPTGIWMPNRARTIVRLIEPFGSAVPGASREESALFDPPPR
jgi:hypothetical protein